MDEKRRELSGWRTMGAQTRVYFVLAMVLIGFGLLDVFVNILAPESPTRDAFYSASLYSNTVGIVLLLVSNIRILKERDRRVDAERASHSEPKEGTSMATEAHPLGFNGRSLPRQTVRGAVYHDPQSGERLRLLRLGGSRVLVDDATVDSEPFYMETADFARRFELTDDHDHENFCCLVHHSHVSPHRGCILR